MGHTSTSINGETKSIYVAPSTPLLWVLREQLGLTGTKFGCGMALCGACTVHVDGKAVRSCVTPVAASHVFQPLRALGALKPHRSWPNDSLDVESAQLLGCRP